MQPRQTRKTFISLAALMLVMAAAIFLAAGTLNYWQAWVFLILYAGASLAITLYLLIHDPALLERRMKAGPTAETRTSQKIIMGLASPLGFIGLVVVPALDRRFGWSDTAAPTALFGDVLVMLGWLAIFAVFRANSFAAATIDVAPDQQVISTGPYALVRHPMYAGALLMLVGIPIALGSWWGLLALAGMAPALVWRLLDEERFLAANLPGYVAYQDKVSHRLIPYLW